MDVKREAVSKNALYNNLSQIEIGNLCFGLIIEVPVTHFMCSRTAGEELHYVTGLTKLF